MISFPTDLRSIGVTRRIDYKDYSPISYWSVAFISEGEGGAAWYRDIALNVRLFGAHDDQREARER